MIKTDCQLSDIAILKLARQNNHPYPRNHHHNLHHLHHHHVHHVHQDRHTTYEVGDGCDTVNPGRPEDVLVGWLGFKRMCWLGFDLILLSWKPLISKVEGIFFLSNRLIEDFLCFNRFGAMRSERLCLF